MSELKPCPFCGGEAEAIRNDIGVFIGCFNADCPIGPATSTYVDGYATEAEAIAAWNTRHVETCENMREKFGYKRLFVCSECGVSFDPDCEINYCPSCGRKVVDE